MNTDHKRSKRTKDRPVTAAMRKHWRAPQRIPITHMKEQSLKNP